MAEKQKKRILVVDDEPDIRLFLKTVLEDNGFEVDSADNGKHALERIKDCIPDLITVDLVMPKMRGITLISYLEKNPDWSQIPFIVVTAHAHDELGKEDFLKLKAEKILTAPHSYIEKPIVASDYVKAVRVRLGLEEEEVSDSGGLKDKIKDRLATANKKKLEEALKVLGE